LLLINIGYIAKTNSELVIYLILMNLAHLEFYLTQLTVIHYLRVFRRIF